MPPRTLLGTAANERLLRAGELQQRIAIVIEHISALNRLVAVGPRTAHYHGRGIHIMNKS
jgi:hypothetical protein